MQKEALLLIHISKAGSVLAGIHGFDTSDPSLPLFANLSYISHNAQKLQKQNIQAELMLRTCDPITNNIYSIYLFCKTPPLLTERQNCFAHEKGKRDSSPLN